MIGDLWDLRAAAVQILPDQVRIVHRVLLRVAQLISFLPYHTEAATHAQTQTLTTMYIRPRESAPSRACPKVHAHGKHLQRLLHWRQHLERQSSNIIRFPFPRTFAAYKGLDLNPSGAICTFEMLELLLHDVTVRIFSRNGMWSGAFLPLRATSSRPFQSDFLDRIPEIPNASCIAVAQPATQNTPHLRASAGQSFWCF